MKQYLNLNYADSKFYDKLPRIVLVPTQRLEEAKTRLKKIAYSSSEPLFDGAEFYLVEEGVAIVANMEYDYLLLGAAPLMLCHTSRQGLEKLVKTLNLPLKSDAKFVATLKEFKGGLFKSHRRRK